MRAIVQGRWFPQRRHPPPLTSLVPVASSGVGIRTYEQSNDHVRTTIAGDQCRACSGAAPSASGSSCHDAHRRWVGRQNAGNQRRLSYSPALHVEAETGMRRDAEGRYSGHQAPQLPRYTLLSNNHHGFTLDYLVIDSWRGKAEQQ